MSAEKALPDEMNNAVSVRGDEDPVFLFGSFVSVVRPDSLDDQSRAKLSAFVKDLCARVPSVAQCLVDEILSYLKETREPEAPRHEPGINHARHMKRRRQLDNAYQPPKSSKPRLKPTKPDRSNTGFDDLTPIGEVVTRQESETQTNQSTESLTTEDLAEQPATNEAPQEVLQERSTALSSSTSREPAQHLVERSDSNVPTEDAHQRQGSVCLHQSNTNDQSAYCPPSPIHTTQTETTLQRPDMPGVPARTPSRSSGSPKSEMHHVDSSGASPVTPMRQICRGLISPSSECQTVTPATTLFTANNGTPQREESPRTCPPEAHETTLPLGMRRSPSNTREEFMIPSDKDEASDTRAPSAPSIPHITGQHEAISSDASPMPSQQINTELHSQLSEDRMVTPTTTLLTADCAASPITEAEQVVDMTSSLKQVSPSLLRIGTSGTTSPNAQQTVDQSTPVTSDCRSRLPDSEKCLTLTEMIARAVHLMHGMRKRQEVPSSYHSSILRSFCFGVDETSTSAVLREQAEPVQSKSVFWSASMWIDIIEAGQARSEESTILNMIEWMGAARWYDAELARVKGEAPLTKRGKPRRRLATVVLEEYLGAAHNNIIATVAPRNDNNQKCGPAPNSTEVQNKIFERRRRLNKIFHRGRILNTLVQKTHLGVLFDSQIWSYAKATKAEVDKFAESFQADPQKMSLLSILSEQVEWLVNTGRPDLSRFIDMLESNSLLATEEVTRLRVEYGFEKEPIQENCLATGIDQVIQGVGQVLRKDVLANDDSVIVNYTAELSCKMFEKLRSKKWLDCWDIVAILEMVEKPQYLQVCVSIPLHTKDAHGEVTTISGPFRGLKKTIIKSREDKDPGKLQVYLCPLNLNTNHFTLLEVNEQTKTISHYDSNASSKIIYRKSKSTIVRREVEKEFKDLGFRYIEAPTPQQNDGWSCSLMVVRNAKRRMMELPVGDWKDEVDPERVIVEVVGNCQMFLENGLLQPGPLRKRKRIVEGPEGDNCTVSRKSARLK